MASIIREYRTSIGTHAFLVVVTRRDAEFVSHVFRADAHGQMRPFAHGNRWPIEFHDGDAHRAFERAIKFLGRVANDRRKRESP